MIVVGKMLLQTQRCDVANRLVFTEISRIQLPVSGGRAFPVAAAHPWNRLPDNVTSTRSN